MTNPVRCQEYQSFMCPNCGKRIGFSAEKAGHSEPCPKCLVRIMIPGRGDDASFIVGTTPGRKKVSNKHQTPVAERVRPRRRFEVRAHKVATQMPVGLTALASACGFALVLVTVFVWRGSSQEESGKKQPRLASTRQVEESKAPAKTKPSTPERPTVVPAKIVATTKGSVSDTPVMKKPAETKSYVERNPLGAREGLGSVWLPNDPQNPAQPDRKPPSPDTAKEPEPAVDVERPAPEPAPTRPPFQPSLEPDSAEQKPKTPDVDPPSQDPVPRPVANEPKDTLTHPPGRTFRFRWDRAKTELPVYVPTDYDPKSPPPVVVFFHGTNGRPSVGLIVSASGGSGFIVVGQAYIRRGLFSASASQASSEWYNTKRMLAALSKELPFDRKRIYVSGFSKGGWMASLIQELHPNEIAGAFIGGAGRVPFMPRTSVRARTPKPVYIGVGEVDANCTASRAGIEYFTRLNAQVTYDEFPGVGHTCVMTQRMHDWFHVERLRGTDELQAVAKEKIDEVLNAQTGSWERYRALTELRQSPWYPIVPASSRKAVEDAVTALKKDPEVAPQLRGKAAYERMLQKEIVASNTPVSGTSIAHARASELKRRNDMIEGYRRITKEHAGTFFADKAQAGIARVESHVQLLKRRWAQRAP